MKREAYQVQLITPCLCAGADQSEAEIRAASVRGQLRWWFRLVDTNPLHEADIFGSVAGDHDCYASAVTVRVRDFRPSMPSWKVPEINQNAPDNYIWHFASISGATQRGAKGPRWNPKGAIAPGSTFVLQLLWRRKLPPELEAKFRLALRAFLALGTLGLRSTRGLGAFHCVDTPDATKLEDELTKAGFLFRWRDKPEGFASYEAALKDYAAWLRFDLRKQFKADRSSPLGGSVPRQASAVRFRCFIRSDRKFGWLAYEAPHGRVLGADSPKHGQILAQKSFNGAPPSAPPARRR